MSSQKRKFFSGRSVEQAVMAAASHYGISPEELAYREIEKKHGFVRARRNAVIQVDPDHPRKEAPSEAAAPSAPQAAEGRERRGGARPPRRREKTVEPVAEAEPEPEPEPEPKPEPEPEREEGAVTESEAPEPSQAEGAAPDWWYGERVEGEERAASPEQEPAREPARRVSRSEGLTRSESRRPEPAAREGGREEGRRGGGREERRDGGGGSRREGRGRQERGERRERGGRRRREAPAPERPPEPPLERPAPRAERLERVEQGELSDTLLDALDILLDFIDVEAEADLFRDGDRLEVELYGPDDQVLLEDGGRILLAMEHLLPRMIRGLYGETMPVRVDCADFHFEREKRLRQLARRTADEVRRKGKPRTLEELDPAERRIVHVTLADDPSVETESVGNGYYKRLRVRPR